MVGESKYARKYAYTSSWVCVRARERRKGSSGGNTGSTEMELSLTLSALPHGGAEGEDALYLFQDLLRGGT